MSTAQRFDVSCLEAGAILSIDLNALVENWRTLQAVCGAAECAAVVKADAYGIGLAPVVEALRDAGCKTFFVAHVFEGRRVRGLAPESVIYVLNGLLPGSAPAYAQDGLRPVLGSLPEIEEWLQFVALWGGARAPDGDALAAALQIDTGMNRLGLKEKDFDAAEQLTRHLNIALVLSHFVWSGQANDVKNERQIELFSRLRAQWLDVPASMANSAGIFLDQTPLYDLVRPGYALYGGNPTPGRNNPMRGVVRLDAKIIQVREVEAGESVGYEGRWTAKARRRLATINAGYADGIPFRAMGSDRRPGAEALIHGRRCPFVGRVSMDLAVLDVTDVEHVQRGDQAELIGPTITIDELAARAGTIGYEILTHLGQRFYRRYTTL
ncbi:alanine racemase [Methylocapsa aurea]|uniref:alanine racemase n=1 Tax=Methylocapsa aurea TaxID=663610 RepID=UPI00068A6A3A|nr:alanine racemase [Methylocapsa aurea]